MRKAILALAFLSGGSNALLLSSDNTTESSSFFGTCSEAKCTNIFATYDDITDAEKCEDPFVRTIQSVKMAIGVDASSGVDVGSVKLYLGSGSYETAVGASSRCTEKSIMNGDACYVMCDSTNTTESQELGELETCSILDGLDSIDVTNYFLYTAYGAASLDNCPNDDPAVCPYLYVLAESDEYEKPTASGFGVNIALDFNVGCAQMPCMKHKYNSTKSFSCNQDECPVTQAYYYGSAGDDKFNPDRCDITYAHLSVNVSGDYGYSNGSQIFVGDVANPINDGTQLPAEDVLCKGDPGSCPADQYDICISDYPVEDYLEPANSYILNLGVKNDDQISGTCPIFSVKSYLEYEYTCDCAPTPFPTTPDPSPLPSAAPSPKPSSKPTFMPSKKPIPMPTPMPTPACHTQHANWQTGTTQDPAGPVIFQTYTQIKTHGRECVLDKATLYMAADSKSTPFASMGSVNVLIGSENISSAESGAGTACSEVTFDNGHACEATCDNGDDTDHSGDEDWPEEFASWSTFENTSYSSCNEFYSRDVTSYLRYHDFEGCTEDVIDPATCPTLALEIRNNDYPGGTPQFEMQTSLAMELTCNCVPTEVQVVTLERSMTCEDVGDCPVEFIFPPTSGGNDLPFSEDCSVLSATLDISSRAYRTQNPVVTFSSGTKTENEPLTTICQANVDPTTPSCTGPATAFDECFGVLGSTSIDVQNLIDFEHFDTLQTLASVKVKQGVFVDQNEGCPDSEIDATLTWTYTCQQLDDDI